MKNFIRLSILLAVIIIAVSLLLDNMMGIFIVCVLTCLLLDLVDKEKRTKNHE